MKEFPPLPVSPENSGTSLRNNNGNNGKSSSNSSQIKKINNVHEKQTVRKQTQVINQPHDSANMRHQSVTH